jgi:hypothetical protein
MKNTFFKNAFISASLLVVVGYANFALAHNAGGSIDAGSNNASATDLAAVSCYDDGGGTPSRLFAQIKDMSAPVPGLLTSFHIYKGTQMTTTTDTVSGDANYSGGVSLNGGPGTYYISVSKTDAGVRIFDIIYHCLTSAGDHTGTDIAVYQVQ